MPTRHEILVRVKLWVKGKIGTDGETAAKYHVYEQTGDHADAAASSNPDYPALIRHFKSARLEERTPPRITRHL